MTVSCIDISNLISQLKCGKAVGSDDWCAEYFKFACIASKISFCVMCVGLS